MFRSCIHCTSNINAVPNCNEYKQIFNNQKLKTHSMHRIRSEKKTGIEWLYVVYVPDLPAYDKICSTSTLCTIQPESRRVGEFKFTKLNLRQYYFSAYGKYWIWESNIATAANNVFSNWNHVSIQLLYGGCI